MIKIYCLTKEVYVVIIHNILSDMLDPRLLGKILSLTSVFFYSLGKITHAKHGQGKNMCLHTCVQKHNVLFLVHLLKADVGF